MPLDQLRRQKAIVTACMESLKNMLGELHRYRRDVPAAAAMVPGITVWIRQGPPTSWPTWNASSAHSLGTPTTTQIEALRRRLEEAA